MAVKTKTVYINGNFLSQPITGVQRFGNEIIRELDWLCNSGDIHFIVLANKKALDHGYNYKNVTIKKIGFTSGKIWEQLDLFFYTFGKPLLTFAGGSPVFKFNQYFTIHDTAIYDEPGGFTVLYRIWYKILNAIVTTSAKKIFTVSHFSASRLVQVLHIKRSKIEIVYSGGDHIENVAADASILSRLPQNKKYVLVVGSLNPNKNFDQVIKVATALQSQTDIQFIIVGNVNNRVFQSTDKNDVHQMHGNMTYLGRISDEELKALYEAARCFLFLSLYEGFGVPVIEAIFCGCPVICSNSACLPEIYNHYVAFVNPVDTPEIAASIKKVLYDDAFYNDLKMRAVAATAVYRWRECAKKIYNVMASGLM